MQGWTSEALRSQLAPGVAERQMPFGDALGAQLLVF